jgi:hypothetical protein
MKSKKSKQKETLYWVFYTPNDETPEERICICDGDTKHDALIKIAEHCEETESIDPAVYQIFTTPPQDILEIDTNEEITYHPYLK